MDKRNLIKRLNEIEGATPKAAELLAQLFTEASFSKGVLLTSPVHSFRILYYINTGLAYGYVAYQREQYTFTMADHGFLLSVNDLTILDNPAAEYIQFIEHTDVFALNLTIAETLEEEQPLVYKMLLSIYEEKIREDKKHLIMLTLPKSRRLAYAEDNYGNVIYKVRRAILASFLNIELKYLYKIMRRRK